MAVSSTDAFTKSRTVARSSTIESTTTTSSAHINDVRNVRPMFGSSLSVKDHRRDERARQLVMAS